MITTNPDKPSRELLAQAAHALEGRGYRVVVEPSGAVLPGFLRDYRPDLLAFGPGENLVVEFKTDTRYASVKRLSDVARAVDNQPGWRFVLAFADDDPASVGIERQTLSVDQALERVARGEELRRSGDEDAAFLVLWTSLEATLRRYSGAVGLVVGNMPPSALLRELYSLGELSWEEYETAMSALKRRNVIAHGFHGDIGQEAFDALANLTKGIAARIASPPDD